MAEREWILLNPGPANTTPSVRAALVMPDLCHREPECFDMMRRCRENLVRLAGAGADWTAVLFTGSGTAAVEAAICAAVPADGTLVVVNNGVYGDRMLRIARAHGIPTVAVAGDIFAPIAAHLARGAPLADAGDQLDESELQTVELPQPRVQDGTLVGHALVVDRFGNASLDVDHDDMAGTKITLGSTVEVEVAGERYLATYAQTFADVSPGELIVYEDAYRTLAVAINRGDAAATLALRPDAEVRLRPR